MEDLYGARAYDNNTYGSGAPAAEQQEDIVARTQYHVTVGEAPQGAAAVNSVQEVGRQRRQPAMQTMSGSFAVRASMDLHDDR